MKLWSSFPPRPGQLRHALSQLRRDMALHYGSPDKYSIDRLRWVFASAESAARGLTPEQMKQLRSMLAREVRKNPIWKKTLKSVLPEGTPDSVVRASLNDLIARIDDGTLIRAE